MLNGTQCCLLLSQRLLPLPPMSPRSQVYRFPEQGTFHSNAPSLQLVTSLLFVFINTNSLSPWHVCFAGGLPYSLGALRNNELLFEPSRTPPPSWTASSTSPPHTHPPPSEPVYKVRQSLVYLLFLPGPGVPLAIFPSGGSPEVSFDLQKGRATGRW